ncbi:ring finger domain-containing protein [Cordyceps javanica]|nr:ring finger domain-containing protein [Cordyceps javanica]
MAEFGAARSRSRYQAPEHITEDIEVIDLTGSDSESGIHTLPSLRRERASLGLERSSSSNAATLHRSTSGTRDDPNWSLYCARCNASISDTAVLRACGCVSAFEIESCPVLIRCDQLYCSTCNKNTAERWGKSGPSRRADDFPCNILNHHRIAPQTGRKIRGLTPACPVCWEPFYPHSVLSTECHVFHEECIMKILRKRWTCPFCAAGAIGTELWRIKSLGPLQETPCGMLKRKSGTPERSGSAPSRKRLKVEGAYS